MNVQGSASSDRSVPIEVQSPLQAHCFRTKLSTAVILGSLALPAFGVPLPPFSDFQFIGDTSNYTNPGVWEAKQLDITGFVPAASNALLTFDVANDVPGAPSTSLNQPTNAHLYFASTGGDFFLNFEYFFVPPDATSSVHFRDVRLTIDGQLYRDQFLAFNNDLGDPFLGTARDGFDSGTNILGQTGFEARTYVFALQAVPEPSTLSLFVGGLMAVGFVFKRRPLVL